jgi:hypothetical protein
VTALPRDLRPRLARLIPLLASPVSGEVLAAASALERTLASAGLTLHDLAAAAPEPTAGGPARSSADAPAERTARAPADWKTALHECLTATARLGPKDRDFLMSLAEQASRGRAPTDRKAPWLAEIHARIRRAA